MPRKPKIPYDEMPYHTFTYLTPVKIVEPINNRTTWLCKCKCGNYIKVTQKDLTTGNTKSCGCYSKENPNKKTHGLSKTRAYKVWIAIKKRCYNQKSSVYKYYGGKGITVCDEWLNDFQSFYEWLLSQGYDETFPRGVQTIDRIDNTLGYSPANCRLITIGQQQRNKESLKKYEYNGEKHLICEWAEIYNIDEQLLRARLNLGWTFEEAIRFPLHAKPHVKKITISYNGETHTLSEWSKLLGISENTIRSRYRKKFTPDKILHKGKL